MFFGDKFFLLFATVVVFGAATTEGIIVSNGSPKKAEDKKDDQRQEDNEMAQSVGSDYIAGFEHHKGNSREGLGLSDYSNHNLEGSFEGHESFHGDSYHRHFAHGGHYSDSHLLHHHHYHDHHDYHKNHDIGYQKALAIKGLLVPLAGVALLGAAAAFISNPILLQLGVISGIPVGRRKRDTAEQRNILIENEIRSNKIKLLENFMAEVPVEKLKAQEKKWLADYLSCPGMNQKKLCIARLACELYSSEGSSMPLEAEVLTTVVNEILNNELVPKETKMEILHAMETGKKNLTCDTFFCEELENRKKWSDSSWHPIRKKG